MTGDWLAPHWALETTSLKKENKQTYYSVLQLGQFSHILTATSIQHLKAKLSFCLKWTSLIYESIKIWRKPCRRHIKCDCELFLLKIWPLNKGSILQMRKHMNTAFDLTAYKSNYYFRCMVKTGHILVKVVLFWPLYIV